MLFTFLTNINIVDELLFHIVKLIHYHIIIKLNNNDKKINNYDCYDLLY